MRIKVKVRVGNDSTNLHVGLDNIDRVQQQPRRSPRQSSRHQRGRRGDRSLCGAALHSVKLLPEVLIREKVDPNGGNLSQGRDT